MARKNFFQRTSAAMRYIFFGTHSDIVSPIGMQQIDFGVNVSQDSALKFTAVYAAIKLLAENIAALPKSVKFRSERGWEKADHAANRLLSIRPNNYTDIFTFWFTINANLQGWGNAFAVIRYDQGIPVALHQIHPRYVKIGFVDGQKIFEVDCPVGFQKQFNGRYLNWEMLHFMMFSLNGITGIDPITYNAAAIGRGIAAQKFSAEYYSKGGNIKGVLETDQNLGTEAYKSFTKRFTEASGNFETPLLEYGIKYKNISINPVAAQLIQSETLSIQDIARIFNVPPHLLAELTHATFSNIEQQNIFFGTHSLRPICKRLENQLEDKLFQDDEKANYSVKFDLKGFMRGDSKSRSEYYRNAINSGFMTRNEVRNLEELPALDGLDNPLQPLNMVPVGSNDDNNKNSE